MGTTTNRWLVAVVGLVVVVSRVCC